MSTWCGWRYTPSSTSSEASFTNLLLTGWQFQPLTILVLGGLGVVYAIGWQRLSKRHPASDTLSARRWYFVAGYSILLVAIVSPLHAFGEVLFSAHMVQHILLTLVAAPLLLLASSMPVMLWGMPKAERVGIGRLVGRPGPTRRVLKWLTFPLVAWWLFIANQWLWHQPVAYEWALRDPWAHSAEHLSFLVTAVLFWWPVIGAAPLLTRLGYPARLLYTFLAWLPNSVLGAGIALSASLLYPYYAEQAAAYGVDAFADQQLAGLIMWVPGDLLFVSILLLLFVAFMRAEERAAARLDRELDVQGIGGGAPKG